MPGTVHLVHWLFSQFLDVPAFLELIVSWGNESTKNLYDIFQVVISVIKRERSERLGERKTCSRCWWGREESNLNELREYS